MRATLQQVRKARRYSEEFKRELVSLFESGQFSVLQLEKLYGISNVNLYRWIYQFSTFNEKGFRVVEMKASTINKVKELQQRVRELEQSVGQKQIKIDYLEQLIAIAQTELRIDIKKNYSNRPSSGSAPTPKK